MLLSKYSKYLIFVFFLFMSGCTTTEWRKDNVTTVEKNKAITKCRATALEKLPPDNKVVSENKAGKKVGKKRGIIEHYEKDYDYTDANERCRQTIFNNCMYDAGWESLSRKAELADFLTF